MKDLRSITFSISLMLAAPVCGSSAAQSFDDASDLLLADEFVFGVGASIVDINADGLPDIYRRNALYIQRSDGNFRDIYSEIGFSEQTSGGFGAIFGDVNNDGFLEAFQIDLEPSLPFYLNRAGMRMIEHSNDSGIRDVTLVQGSSFLDFDSNGLLDLFIGIDGGRPNLYWNVGLNHFLDRGVQYGFDLRYAYGVAVADYDRDGDPDILLTQCFPPPGESLRENVLYRNDGEFFTNVREEAGILDDLQSWGVVWLDYDNDGFLDFYVGNTSQDDVGILGLNTLYRNRGDGTFEDVSIEAGVQTSDSSQSVGVSAADFDNDGWVDLFVTETAVGEAALYRNNGDGTFTNIWQGTSSPVAQSQAVAVGDVNGDGWIDLFQPTFLGDQLLLNRGGSNHYLVVHLRGVTSNHFGVGGRIDLFAGDMRQIREITAGDGMTSQNHNLSAHFGLGQATQIDSLLVRWPGGLLEKFTGIGANQSVTIVEGVGLNDPPERFSLTSPLRKTTISSDTETLDFEWSEARDDTDVVRYALNIHSVEFDTTISNLTSTSVTLVRSLFIDGVTYRWNVTSTDGYSVRAAPYAEFVFGPSTALEGSDIPTPVSRWDAYPNPFQDLAIVSIHVERPVGATIEVFDVTGRLVETLYEGRLESGSNRFDWMSADLAPGLYFVRARIGSEQRTRFLVRR